MNENDLIAHLLRRAGFGASPAELEQARRDGYEETLERLLAFESVPDPAEAEVLEVADSLLDLRNAEDVRTEWLFRMARTTRPLRERMTLFWHNHFATSVKKVEQAELMTRQIDLFRRHAVGNFRSLLLDVSRDPAMLIFLDGRANKKGAPNENYGREVMELFTLGIGNYTEQDVKEVARAFTGWGLKDGQFFFEPKQHDDGEKEILGKKGKLDGTDVVDLLAAHPATAKRLARKLCLEFIGPSPEQATIDMLAAEYARSGYDMRAVLRALFTSDAFKADAALRARVKSPVELVIGSLRALPGAVPVKLFVGLLRRMGQDLLAPPTVKGWDGGAGWLSTTTMLARLAFARDSAVATGNQASPAFKPAEVVHKYSLDTAEKLVDHMLERFGPLDVSPTVRAKIVEYALAPEDPKGPVYPAPAAIDSKVRGTAQLVLSLPEYQLA